MNDMLNGLLGKQIEQAGLDELFSIVHPDDLENVKKTVREHFSTGTVFALNCRLRSSNNKEYRMYTLEWILLCGKNGEPEVWLGNGKEIQTSLDMEDRLHNLEETVNKSHYVMDVANRISLDILASSSGREALQHIVESAKELAQAQYAALGVANASGDGLVEFMTSGLSHSEERAIGKLPKGLGILGLLIKSSHPISIKKLSDHPSSVGFPPNHPSMDSFLGVPIRRGDQTIGSLYLTNKIGGEEFTEKDEIAVSTLSAHAAVAIHNLHMISKSRALIGTLIQSQEEERRAIAYEIHDELAQQVMASHAHLEAYQSTRGVNEPKAEKEFEAIKKCLKAAVIESRRLVNGLRSLALDDLGLSGALEVLLMDEKQHAGWEHAELIHNISTKRFHKNLETTIYRVAQEALSNIRKHAKSEKVLIMLWEDDVNSASGSHINLTVKDWGIGFSPGDQNQGYSHIGLHSMQERTTMAGGQFSIHSSPEDGTLVKAIFPTHGFRIEETEK